MTTQYPGLRVPESSMMSQQGKDFRIKLQASRGDKFRGVISEFLHLNPWGEGIPSFEEPEDFDDEE